jgi:CRP-like cAMP-binding protein
MAFSKKYVPNCDLCRFQRDCIYNRFDLKTKKVWKGLRTSAYFHDGEFLFHEGEQLNGLYIVCQGRIKIYKTSPIGQQLIYRIQGPGDFAGHISLFAGGVLQASGEVMKDTIVSFIDSKNLMTFLNNHLNACLMLLQELALEVRAVDMQAYNIAYRPALERVADILNKKATQKSKGAKFKLEGIKRKEIAELTGLTVETTVRILADFEKKKLIQRDGKEIVILDRQKLNKLTK